MTNVKEYSITDRHGETHLFDTLKQRSMFIELYPDLFKMPIIPENNMVEHPPHYADRKYEVIDVMQDTMTPEQFKGYLLGCTQKYLFRWDKKEKPLQDLQKAKWYLNKLIQTIEEETKCCG